MNRISLVVLFILLFSFRLDACLNRYYTVDKYGHAHDNGHAGLIWFNTNFNVELLDWEIYELSAKLKEEHSYMLLSDYAVALLKLGKTKVALQLLVQLYAHYPAEYKLASNLGTAYELNGENDSALKYIRRGIELYPHDHDGSEWIHVKILETKIKLKEDRSWLKNHSVLELTDTQKNDPVVCKQLYIQMHERFPFTLPVADPIMASLFTDLGDLYYNTKSVAIGLICYMTARDYFKASSTTLDVKIAEAEKMNEKSGGIQIGEEQTKGRKAIILNHINFESCFYDNDEKKFKVNWKEIETDPKVLLAMVNLNMPVKKAREEALKNQSGDLKLISDSADVKTTAAADLPPIEQGRGKSNSMMVILLSVVTAATAGLVIFRMKKKRSGHEKK